MKAEDRERLVADADWVLNVVDCQEIMDRAEGSTCMVDGENWYDLLQRAESLARGVKKMLDV